MGDKVAPWGRNGKGLLSKIRLRGSSIVQKAKVRNTNQHSQLRIALEYF